MKRQMFKNELSKILDYLYPGSDTVPTTDILDIFSEVEERFEVHVTIWRALEGFMNDYEIKHIPKTEVFEIMSDWLGLNVIDYLLELIGLREIEDDKSLLLGSPLDFNKLKLKDSKEQIITSDYSKSNNVGANTQKSDKYNEDDSNDLDSSSLLTNVTFFKSQFFLIINLFLILIIIAINVFGKPAILEEFNKFIYSLFIYETTDDIYWWQRWGLLEKIVWSLLDV